MTGIILPKLPKEWKWCKISHIAEKIHYGYTTKAKNENTGTKYVRITDINGYKVKWETVPFCDIKLNQVNKYLLRDGDIVFARTGATVGNSYLIRGEIPKAIFASYLIRLVLNKRVECLYVSYFFQSPFYWRQIQTKKYGIAQPNLNGKILSTLDIPLPIIRIQKQISKKLEELFIKLNFGVSKLKTAKALLERYRQSLLKVAMEGKLTKTKRQIQVGSFIAQKSCYQTWKREKLSNLAKLCGGGTPSTKNPKYWGGDILWLTPSDVTKQKKLEIRDSMRKITKLGLHKSSAKIIPKQSVLMTSRATIGEVIINQLPVTTNQGFINIYDFKDDLLPKFLAYWIMSEKYEILKLGAGTTFNEISKRKFRELRIPIPSLAEQRLIVKKLDTFFLKLESNLENIKKMIHRARMLRQKILTHAFEGKLVSQSMFLQNSKVNRSLEGF